MKIKKRVPTETFLGPKKEEIQGQFDDVSPVRQESASSNRVEIIGDHKSVSLNFIYSNEHEEQANIENWD